MQKYNESINIIILIIKNVTSENKLYFCILLSILIACFILLPNFSIIFLVLLVHYLFANYYSSLKKLYLKKNISIISFDDIEIVEIIEIV